MSRAWGQFCREPKAKLKISLAGKNKVFGATKLFAGVFSILVVSSLLDTAIVRTASAATDNTTTMKLKDVAVGSVIDLGAYSYVKVADNEFMQTEAAACPDGKTVAGKYVKCFTDSNTYTQTCTGSYYCNTSNTSWNSSTGKCDSSVTCPDGSTYCGDHSQWDSATSKCVGVGSCGNNAYITDAVSNVCTCAPGYYANTSGGSSTTLGGSCGYVACSSGTYADGSGTGYTPSGSTCSYKQCSGTNVNTSTYTNTNSCSCASNYYSSNTGDQTTTVGGKCEYTACASNKYADASGHKYTSTGSCTYIACGANATTTYGDGACSCNSGYSWNSETSACEEVKCGEHSTQSGDSCVCDSGYYGSVSGTGATPYTTTVALGESCSIHYDSSTGYFVQNGTNYYLASGGTLKTGCNGTMIGGFCWGAISSSTYTWANRNSGCASGYSVPTVNQFYALENILGCSGTYDTDCRALTTAKWGGSDARYWSATEYDSSHAYALAVNSNHSYVYYYYKTSSYYVRCIKN